MSKTAFTLKMKTNLEIEKSIRRTWASPPTTKIFKNKKAYDRKQSRALERSYLG